MSAFEGNPDHICSRPRPEPDISTLGPNSFSIRVLPPSPQERRYLIKAAIPRIRKMMTRTEIRPIPNIIPVDISVICIILDCLSMDSV